MVYSASFKLNFSNFKNAFNAYALFVQSNADQASALLKKAFAQFEQLNNAHQYSDLQALSPLLNSLIQKQGEQDTSEITLSIKQKVEALYKKILQPDSSSVTEETHPEVGMEEGEDELYEVEEGVFLSEAEAVDFYADARTKDLLNTSITECRTHLPKTLIALVNLLDNINNERMYGQTLKQAFIERNPAVIELRSILTYLLVDTLKPRLSSQGLPEIFAIQQSKINIFQMKAQKVNILKLLEKRLLSDPKFTPEELELNRLINEIISTASETLTQQKFNAISQFIIEPFISFMEMQTSHDEQEDPAFIMDLPFYDMSLSLTYMPTSMIDIQPAMLEIAACKITPMLKQILDGKQVDLSLFIFNNRELFYISNLLDFYSKIPDRLTRISILKGIAFIIFDQSHFYQKLKAQSNSKEDIQMLEQERVEVIDQFVQEAMDESFSNSQTFEIILEVIKELVKESRLESTTILSLYIKRQFNKNIKPDALVDLLFFASHKQKEKYAQAINIMLEEHDVELDLPLKQFFQKLYSDWT